MLTSKPATRYRRALNALSKSAQLIALMLRKEAGDLVTPVKELIGRGKGKWEKRKERCWWALKKVTFVTMKIESTLVAKNQTTKRLLNTNEHPN